MIRKKMVTGQLACSVAVGALALAPMVAFAQGDTTTGGASGSTSGSTGGGSMSGSTTGGGSMSGGASGSMSMSSQPVQASGTVERYYTDRSGYVTGADLRTAEGTQMVHFGPGLGNRITTAYPAGGNAQLWVTPGAGGTGHWNVVGWGQNMPAAGFMSAHTATDVDMLEGEPYIMAGTKMTTIKGELTNIITNDLGHVVALVLNGNAGNTSGPMMPGVTPGTGGMSDHMLGGANYSGAMQVGGSTIVRVGREFRSLNPNTAGTRRATALYKGAHVEATGYPEAPLYGVVSIYNNRLAANAISVDGESVGYGTLAPMQTRGKPLLGFNINLPFMGSAQPATEPSTRAGYTTYDPGSMGTNTGGTMDAAGGTSGGAGSGSTGGATGPSSSTGSNNATIY